MRVRVPPETARPSFNWQDPVTKLESVSKSTVWSASHSCEREPMIRGMVSIDYMIATGLGIYEVRRTQQITGGSSCGAKESTWNAECTVEIIAEGAGRALGCGM